MSAEVQQLSQAVERCRLDASAAADRIQTLKPLIAQLSSRDVSSSTDSAKEKELETAIEKEEKV